MSTWLIIKIIILVGVLGFMTWYSIHTKNWGKFNRTSMIVWGIVLLLLVASLVAVRLIVHSAA